MHDLMPCNAFSQTLTVASCAMVPLLLHEPPPLLPLLLPLQLLPLHPRLLPEPLHQLPLLKPLLLRLAIVPASTDCCIVGNVVPLHTHQQPISALRASTER